MVVSLSFNEQPSTSSSVSMDSTTNVDRMLQTTKPVETNVKKSSSFSSVSSSVPVTSTPKTNPYLMLEDTWQRTKSGATSKNELSSSTLSSPLKISVIPFDSSSVPPLHQNGHHTARDNVKQLNLSAMCMSNILMLEDRHIPSVFIRMYEHCLKVNEIDPENTANLADLRLLNYIIQCWHETRNRLTFYRDMFKVIASLAKPFVGDHFSIAVESTPINQKHVVKELIRTVRDESRGRSVGEFLEQWSRQRHVSDYSFHDMGQLELFTRSDVLEWQSDETANPVHLFFTRLMKHPVSAYSLQLVRHILKMMIKMNLNMPSSACDSLFEKSCPSWAEEDTDSGIINMDNETIKRVNEARENIRRMLTNRTCERRPKHVEPNKRKAIVPTTSSSAVSTTSSTSTDSRVEIVETAENTQSPKRMKLDEPTVVHHHKNDTTEDDDDENDEYDDVRTIDTASFLGVGPFDAATSNDLVYVAPPVMDRPVYNHTRDLIAKHVKFDQDINSSLAVRRNNVPSKPLSPLREQRTRKSSSSVSSDESLSSSSSSDDEEADYFVTSETEKKNDNQALRSIENNLRSILNKSSLTTSTTSQQQYQSQKQKQQQFPKNDVIIDIEDTDNGDDNNDDDDEDEDHDHEMDNLLASIPIDKSVSSLVNADNDMKMLTHVSDTDTIVDPISNKLSSTNNNKIVNNSNNSNNSNNRNNSNNSNNTNISNNDTNDAITVPVEHHNVSDDMRMNDENIDNFDDLM